MFVNIKLVLLTPFIYFLMHNHAYAYLDPGTGSTILAAIAAALAAGTAPQDTIGGRLKIYI